MSKSKKANSKKELKKEISNIKIVEIKEELNKEMKNDIQNNENKKIDNNDIESNKIEKMNKEQDTDKTEQIDDSEKEVIIEKSEEIINNDKITNEDTIIEEKNEEKKEIKEELENEHEKFTIILTPKGYKYSEDGENIAYDEDAYRYKAEYEEDDVKENRMKNLNKALEGKIEKDEIDFLQQYGDLSLAKIMSQYEKSDDIPKEYIEKIKALAKENKISIKYDLTKSSVFSRFASIFKREKALDLDQIDELKAMAYNARGYAEIKASPMIKLSFKVKDMVRGSNQKMLGDGKESIE